MPLLSSIFGQNQKTTYIIIFFVFGNVSLVTSSFRLWLLV